MVNSNIICIDDTRFIYETNFSGNSDNDRFGDTRRKANIVIPNPDQAKEMIKNGFKVRNTKPRPDDDPDEFEPEFFVTAILKFRDKRGNLVKYPPHVYLVSGDSEPVLLDEDTVGRLDDIRVKNVNVVLNPYVFDAENDGKNLYIRTMYVEQDLDDDPYAARYRRV